VTSISAGFDFSLATRPRGNTALTSVWTWGGNSEGQLGDGTFSSRVIPEPVNGIGTLFIASAVAGDGYGMVLGTDGSVWAWGADYHGQLGNAPTSTPVTHPVNTIGGGSGITQLATGATHVLGLRSDGTVLAWGTGHLGELGNGTTPESSGPVQVTGLTGVSQVSAGWSFSLAVHVVPPVAA
jgi:alpha-tubulin suppressor-like RCC1 family protein